ncbi:MAG: hypothetical protein ACRDQ7_12535 [Haloechinothrix sp.]
MGADTVDVATLLASLARAELRAREHDSGETSADYRAGAADAYADMQTLVREQAGWPLEPASVIDQP